MTEIGIIFLLDFLMIFLVFCSRCCSIMQRAKVLERGLADRVPAVQAECLSMLKTWLTRDCEGDVIALLRYLDVETNEKVGESVLNELQKQGLIKANEGEGLRQFLLPLTGESTGLSNWLFLLCGKVLDLGLQGCGLSCSNFPALCRKWRVRSTIDGCRTGIVLAYHLHVPTC
jgi:hypothetical protein